MADPTHWKSTLTVQTFKVAPVDGSDPFLIVEVTVGCPGCGGFTQRIAGHHMLALTEAFTAVLKEQAANPALLGPGIQEDQVKRTKWEGMAPGSGKETLN